MQTRSREMQARDGGHAHTAGWQCRDVASAICASVAVCFAADLVDVVAGWLERHDRDERLARDEDERFGFATRPAPS
jgi:hypothetical protein